MGSSQWLLSSKTIVYPGRCGFWGLGELRTEGMYSWVSWPRWIAIEVIVGTLPESVVKRLVRLPLASFVWSLGATLVPLRGGETRPINEVSWRGDCWLRKRSSSIRSTGLVG